MYDQALMTNRIDEERVESRDKLEATLHKQNVKPVLS